MRMRTAVVAACLLMSSAALAADDITLRDAFGTNKIICTDEKTGARHSYCMHIMSGANGSTNVADVDANGALETYNQKIDDVETTVNSVPVFRTTIHDGTGAQITNFGGTNIDDNSAFTGGTTDVTPTGFLYDTTPPAVTDGNVGAPRMTVNRDARVHPVDGSGDSMTDDANNAQRVTVVSGPAGGTSTVDDAAFTAGAGSGTPIECFATSDAMDSGDVGVVKCNTDRELIVNVDSMPTGASATQTQGDVANDNADSGNPHKVGGRARTSDITAVANDDRVDAQFGTLGEQIVRNARTDALVSGCANATGTADTQIIAAQGAGKRIYLTDYMVTNSSATNTGVTFKSATTARWGPVAAPANWGGAVTPFESPIRLGDNEAANFASFASVTTMYVCFSGYVASN